MSYANTPETASQAGIGTRPYNMNVALGAKPARRETTEYIAPGKIDWVCCADEKIKNQPLAPIDETSYCSIRLCQTILLTDENNPPVARLCN